LKLEKVDAIKSWRALMGPTKFEVAQKEAPNSLRATFATDTTKNAVHGSDSTESAARELDFYFNVEHTLAVIKPDAVAAGKGQEICDRIESEGFSIIERCSVSLTKERAEAFYAEHQGKGFFADLVEFMTSGPVIALKLEKKDAIKAWRSLMGPTNFETAKKEAPQSIRALYASSMTKNASHGSDSVSAAVRELDFYFAPEVTLAMIKPDAVSAGNAPAIMDRIVKEGFTILESKKVTLTKERAEAFYAEHKGKGFFDDLVSFMVSGPIYALKLSASNGILKWRGLMGPTNFEVAKQEAPQSIRALYASSMTKNASHGSDSAESAKKELEFHFPATGNAPRSTKEFTLAMIKPDAVSAGKAQEIVNRVQYEGFVVVEREEMKLNKERAESFYAEHKGKGFFGELVEFMTSGSIVAMKLERENAIKTWRTVMGPTNFEVAKQEAPDSVRALYATNMTKNASHGSDSAESAKRELDFFFGQ
jgi:nucleoside diphosphate kinase